MNADTLEAIRVAVVGMILLLSVLTFALVWMGVAELVRIKRQKTQSLIKAGEHRCCLVASRINIDQPN